MVQLFYYRNVIKIKSLLLQSCSWNSKLIPAGIFQLLLRCTSTGFSFFAPRPPAPPPKKKLPKDFASWRTKQYWEFIFIVPHSKTLIWFFQPPVSRNPKPSFLPSARHVEHSGIWFCLQSPHPVQKHPNSTLSILGKLFMFLSVHIHIKNSRVHHFWLFRNSYQQLNITFKFDISQNHMHRIFTAGCRSAVCPSLKGL